MARDAARLLEYLRDRLGRQLRSAFEYDDDGSTTLLYVRNDLDEAVIRRRVDRMGALGPDEYEHIAGDTDDEGLSQFGGSVHVFEHALSMLLPDPDGGGIGFSFEPGTGRQLFDFVGACRAAGFQVDDEEGEASSGADGTDTDGGSPDGSAPDADDE